MIQIFSIGFTYKEALHYCIVKTKETDDHTEYSVTVMNGDLERRLYGNHIFTMKDGRVVEQISDIPTYLHELRKAIGDSLNEHLSVLRNSINLNDPEVK